jgi:hypothetical protein
MFVAVYYYWLEVQECRSFTHSWFWFAQEPLLLRFWFVTLGCVVLGALGIGLEVARVVSRDNGGES